MWVAGWTDSWCRTRTARPRCAPHSQHSSLFSLCFCPAAGATARRCSDLSPVDCSAVALQPRSSQLRGPITLYCLLAYRVSETAFSELSQCSAHKSRSQVYNKFLAVMLSAVLWEAALMYDRKWSVRKFYIFNKTSISRVHFL